MGDTNPDVNFCLHHSKTGRGQVCQRRAGHIFWIPCEEIPVHTSVIRVLTFLLTFQLPRRLVAGLTEGRPGFAPWSVHVGFMVNREELGQEFLRVLTVSPVNIIPPRTSH